jgi:hypothetical protein
MSLSSGGCKGLLCLDSQVYFRRLASAGVSETPAGEQSWVGGSLHNCLPLGTRIMHEPANHPKSSGHRREKTTVITNPCSMATPRPSIRLCLHAWCLLTVVPVEAIRSDQFPWCSMPPASVRAIARNFPAKLLQSKETAPFLQVPIRSSPANLLAVALDRSKLPMTAGPDCDVTQPITPIW